MNFSFTKKPNFKYEILGIILILSIGFVYFFEGGNENIYLLVASILGMYMAMNIGANDLANNMGPAVGSKALTITGAIILAGIFEAIGAIIAGGDVVNTIKGGIIDGTMISDPKIFIIIMLSTLLGGAIWMNVATYFKAPVSGTHALIGGLVGSGIMAGGIGIVDWYQILIIASSWVISPLMGGIIAIFILLSIKNNILKKEKRGNAAQTWVPIYIGIMSWTFATYILLKGLKQILKGTVFDILLNTNFAVFIGYIIGVIIFVGLRLHYKNNTSYFKNSKNFINSLFNIPLIFAVSLLSFAHGANNVGNAVGPVIAISDTIKNGFVNNGDLGVPIWIMIFGSIGIILGLSVFGAKLIKSVGGEITKLNQIRAFCITLSTAITVIIASGLGLPVSSTHIALGGIFGVGLLREHFKRLKGKNKEYIKMGMVKNIALAWFITLPVSGAISAITYLLILKLS